MMEILLISLVAFGVAILTFFSGFGLGTLLAPVMMFFFPVDVAIALTGIVHFVNNLFKLFLVGRHANRDVLMRFGIPAVLAAVAGALLMVRLAGAEPWFSYQLFQREWEVYPLKVLIGVVLFVFAWFDLLPVFAKLEFGRKWLSLGGALSGFFGGLSGNQGALRAAFLIKAGLTKQAFVGTAVVVSTFVDLTRLGIYSSRMVEVGVSDNWQVLVFASLSAISGAIIGNRLLQKISLLFLQRFVGTMLLLIALALIMGII